MTNLESSTEHLNNNSENLLDSEIELSNLKSDVELKTLNAEVKKNQQNGKFIEKGTSKDGKYKVYYYIIKKRALSPGIRFQAVKQLNLKNKDGILITDKNGVEYDEIHQFKAGEKVYVKIPIKKLKNDKKANTEKLKPTQQKLETKKETSNKSEIKKQNTNPGTFKYEKSGKDYTVYSYNIGNSTKTYWNILNDLGNDFKLKNDKGILITDSKGKELQGPFKNEKIYIKIPNYLFENDVKIIDGMKCKGGEYFGIDVSRYNDQINLASFEERNNKKWETIGNDKRGVSFIYIRAGDGHPNAKPSEDKKSVTNWTNFVKKHNNDRKVKDKHEQIATGFYWTLTNKKSATTQANDFLKIYNRYKDASGGEKLIPMIDLETDRRKEVKKIHKNKKGKIIKKEYYTPNEFKEKALQWLQHVEKKTGVVPGIYVGAKAYGDHLRGDNRFNKYITWLSAYSSNNSNGREDGNVRRINFKEGSVNVGSSKNPIKVKPTMYQSSQEGTVPGTAAKHKEKDGKTYYDTDMDHTKDITKLFSKNNRPK